MGLGHQCLEHINLKFPRPKDNFIFYWVSLLLWILGSHAMNRRESSTMKIDNEQIGTLKACRSAWLRPPFTSELWLNVHWEKKMHAYIHCSNTTTTPSWCREIPLKKRSRDDDLLIYWWLFLTQRIITNDISENPSLFKVMNNPASLLSMVILCNWRTTTEPKCL